MCIITDSFTVSCYFGSGIAHLATILFRRENVTQPNRPRSLLISATIAGNQKTKINSATAKARSPNAPSTESIGIGAVPLAMKFCHHRTRLSGILLSLRSDLTDI